MAENLGERGDQPPPPPPVPPPDQRTPQISRELEDAYPQETTGTQRAETDGDPVRAATRDASSPSLKEKVFGVIGTGVLAAALWADKPPPPEAANPDRQEYVSPANDKVPFEDLPALAGDILLKTEKVVSSIGEDLKDKADALGDAERLAADRNENAPEIEFRREDLDRSQDEDK